MFLFVFLTEKEQAILEVLYQLYEKPIYYTCFSILKNQADAEDAVHSTFVKLFDLLDRLEPDLESKRNKSFVCTIAKYTSIDILRKQKTETSYLSRLEDEKGYIKNNISDIVDLNCFIEHMYSVNHNHAFLLLFKYVFGFSIHDLSVLFGITETNVKIRLHRAKKTMRNNPQIISFYSEAHNNEEEN